MTNENQEIEGLKKVSLSLEVGSTGEKMDLSPEPVLFEMVVGVGTEGYTPFEYELLGKKTGDTVQIEIAGGNLHEVFGHLDVPLPEKAGTLSSFFLKATVDAIVPAGQTEVVRAMARTISDCGGSCCGNH